MFRSVISAYSQVSVNLFYSADFYSLDFGRGFSLCNKKGQPHKDWPNN